MSYVPQSGGGGGSVDTGSGVVTPPTSNPITPPPAVNPPVITPTGYGGGLSPFPDNSIPPVYVPPPPTTSPTYSQQTPLTPSQLGPGYSYTIPGVNDAAGIAARAQYAAQPPAVASSQPYQPQSSPNNIPSWASGILPGFGGTPVYQPQPQYSFRNIFPGGNPFGANAPPQVIQPQIVPSSQFGSGPGAFRVAGHYVGDPNGSGAVWVPG